MYIRPFVLLSPFDRENNVDTFITYDTYSPIKWLFTNKLWVACRFSKRRTVVNEFIFPSFQQQNDLKSQRLFKLLKLFWLDLIWCILYLLIEVETRLKTQVYVYVKVIVRKQLVINVIVWCTQMLFKRFFLNRSKYFFFYLLIQRLRRFE